VQYCAPFDAGSHRDVPLELHTFVHAAPPHAPSEHVLAQVVVVRHERHPSPSASSHTWTRGPVGSQRVTLASGQLFVHVGRHAPAPHAAPVGHAMAGDQCRHVSLA
jgi:hypothetical protein